MTEKEIASMDHEERLAEVASFMGHRPRNYKGEIIGWYDRLPRLAAEEDVCRSIDNVPDFHSNNTIAFQVIEKLIRKGFSPTLYSRPSTNKNSISGSEFALTSEYMVREAIPDFYWQTSAAQAICIGLLIEHIEAPRFLKP